MTILYKYYDSYFKGLIISPKLKLTPPLHLNDPFERKVPHGLEDIILNFYRPEGLPEKEIRNKTIEICENELNKLGITAMTETHDNILMWSHYANSHKGVCIGYDTEKIKEKDNVMRLLRVKYLEDRFEKSDITCASHTLSGKFSKLEDKIVTTKSPQWQYEKEHRYITSLSRANEILIIKNGKTDEIIDEILERHNDSNYHFDKREIIYGENFKKIKINASISSPLIEELIKYNNVGFYRAIDQESIASVYIGCDSDIDVSDVQHHVDEATLKNIIIRKYQVSDYKFNLEIK